MAKAIVKEKVAELKSKPSVCFEFDGVISSALSPWSEPDVLVDAPAEGVKEALNWFRDRGFIILIHSTRSAWEEGISAMESYMTDHKLPYDKICKNKPPAHFYVDTHGFRFLSWHESLTYFEKYYNSRIEVEANKANRRVINEGKGNY